MTTHKVDISHIPKFNGSYFNIWKHRLTLSFKAEKLWPIVNGTQRLPVAPTAAEVAAGANALPLTGAGSINLWEEQDALALTIINNCLENSVVSHIQSCTTSHLAWSRLISIFESQDVVTKMHLKDRLINLKMKDNASIVKHIHHFSAHLEQLSAAGSPVPDDEAIIMLMRSLPQNYQPFIRSLRRQPGLTLQTLITDLIQEETFIKDSSPTSENTSALYVGRKNFNKGKKSYFNKNFRISSDSKGESSGYKPLEKKILAKEKKCFYCKKPGHHIKDCRARIAAEKSNNARQTNLATTNNKLYVVASKTQGHINSTWYVDSGATQHMCHQREGFTNYTKCQDEQIVYLGDDSTSYTIEGHGDVNIKLTNGEEKSIPDVLHIPGLAKNLFSAKQLDQAGGEIRIKNGTSLLINKSGQIIATCTLDPDLYVLGETILTNNFALATPTIISHNTADLWHLRLGHINQQRLKQIQVASKGIRPFDEKEISLCKSCMEGKQHKLQFPKKGARRATEILELVHSDICGPMQVATHTGYLYFITFIDDYTRFCTIYLIKHKSEAFAKFQQYKSYVEKQTQQSIKILRSDQGGEYLSAEFENFLQHHGIKRETTSAYTPQQNGVSERKNRTLVGAVLSMLSYAKLPKIFWGEALYTANYLQNRSPTKALPINKTPFELWYGYQPNLSYLKVFGCKAHVFIPKEQRRKLDSHSFEAIFLGYSEEVKAYRLMNINTRKLIISRDVVFDEVININSPNNSLQVHEDYEELISIDLLHHQPTHRGDHQQLPPPQQIQQPPPLEPTSSIQHNLFSPPGTSSSFQFDPSTYSIEKEQEIAAEIPHQEETTTASSSKYAPPSSLARPVRHKNPTRRLLESIEGRPSARKITPRKHQANIISLAMEPPKTIHEALSREDSIQWEAAIKAEFDSLHKNQTWTLTKLPPNRKPITSKWIFKIKTKSDGTLDKYKARLVARGFTQVQGLDYMETFSPVVKLNSIKVILALATQYNFEIHQLDVKTAFLNGYLEEDIYMIPPEGLALPLNSDLVCKLGRSLYGLKQSSRAWYLRLDQYLIFHKFLRLESDASIYIKREDNQNFLILTVYVDDCLLVSNQLSLIQNMKSLLQSEFDMSDEGELHFTLGNAIIRNRDEGWIIIHQQKYLISKLEEYNMLDCNPVSTPMQAGIRLSKDDSTPSPQDQHLYSQIVGSLMHAIVNTRPDCAYTISSLAQYLTNPTEYHIQTLKRTLRYIKGTLPYGICYQRSSKGDILHGYSDADWAGCKDTRRSTSGYCFLLANGVISWGSKKQQSVALSSTESEYMALSKATTEAIWLRKLLSELGFPQTNPTTIYSDSQSAIALTANPKYHSRSKHIDTQYHFTREKVLSQEIILQFISTTEMAADILTKSLPAEKHHLCMLKLGMSSIPQSKITTHVQALVISGPVHLCGSLAYLDHSLSGRLHLQSHIMSKICSRKQDMHTRTINQITRSAIYELQNMQIMQRNSNEKPISSNTQHLQLPAKVRTNGSSFHLYLRSASTITTKFRKEKQHSSLAHQRAFTRQMQSQQKPQQGANLQHRRRDRRPEQRCLHLPREDRGGGGHCAATQAPHPSSVPAKLGEEGEQQSPKSTMLQRRKWSSYLSCMNEMQGVYSHRSQTPPLRSATQLRLHCRRSKRLMHQPQAITPSSIRSAAVATQKPCRTAKTHHCKTQVQISTFRTNVDSSASTSISATSRSKSAAQSQVCNDTTNPTLQKKTVKDDIMFIETDEALT